MLKILVIVWLSLSCLSVEAQKIDFWIIHSKDTVGVLNVERKPSGNFLNYKLFSKVDVTFVVHLLIVNNMTIIYENGKLTSADVKQTSNRGVFDADIKTKFDGNKYHVIKNHNSYYVNEKEITWSVGRMYFEEPKGVKAVFAEDNGKLVNLEPKTNGKYGLKVSFPSVFSYKNGELYQMEAETIVGSIFFVRKT